MNFNEISDFYKKIGSAIDQSKEYQSKIDELNALAREEIRPVVVQEHMNKIKELESIKDGLDEMTKNDIETFNNEVSKSINENSQKLVEYNNKLSEIRLKYANDRKNLMDKHSRLFLNENKNTDDALLISAFQKSIENLKSQYEKEVQEIRDSISKIEAENKSLISYSGKMAQPFSIIKQEFESEKNVDDVDTKNAENTNQDSKEQPLNNSANVEKANVERVNTENDNAENGKFNNQQNSETNDLNKKYEVVVSPLQNKEQIIESNTNSNYLQIENGVLDLDVNDSYMSIPLDTIDEKLGKNSKNFNSTISNMYHAALKANNVHDVKKVKFILKNLNTYNNDKLPDNIDKNICKSFQMLFYNVIEKDLQNNASYEKISNDTENINKYFNKYVNSFKTNTRDEDFPITYDVRKDGFLLGRDFSMLKKYAREARGFADVKATKFTRFSWNLRDKLISFATKVHNTFALPEGNEVKDDKKSDNNPNSIDDSKLNEYVDDVINNTQEKESKFLSEIQVDPNSEKQKSENNSVDKKNSPSNKEHLNENSSHDDR